MRLTKTFDQIAKPGAFNAAIHRVKPLPAAVVLTWGALLIYLALLPMPPRVPGV